MTLISKCAIVYGRCYPGATLQDAEAAVQKCWSVRKREGGRNEPAVKERQFVFGSDTVTAARQDDGHGDWGICNDSNEVCAQLQA